MIQHERAHTHTYTLVFNCGFSPAGMDELKPEQQHPLPSYLEYRHNASIRVYQTNYFASKCAESPDSSSKSFTIKLGAEMDSLGGKCDPSQQKFCDGPLKPHTAYRLDALPSFAWETYYIMRCSGSWATSVHMNSCRRIAYTARVLYIILERVIYKSWAPASTHG